VKLSLDISHDHPSEKDLLRFHAGDLAKEHEEKIRAHLSSCSECASFLKELDSFKLEFSSTHSRQGILALVKARSEKDTLEKLQWWRSYPILTRGLLLGTGLASALIIVAVFIPLLHRNTDSEKKASIIVKGPEISLSYLVMENGKPILARPGRILHPKDRIQFRLSAPRGGFVHIVGVDEAGSVTVYFPLPGVKPEPYPGGSGRPVPGSIILDDTLGKERVFVLFCEDPIPRASLAHKVTNAARDPRTWISRQRLPMDCKQTSILLRKEPLQ